MPVTYVAVLSRIQLTGATRTHQAALNLFSCPSASSKRTSSSRVLQCIPYALGDGSRVLLLHRVTGRMARRQGRRAWSTSNPATNCHLPRLAVPCLSTARATVTLLLAAAAAADVLAFKGSILAMLARSSAAAIGVGWMDAKCRVTGPVVPPGALMMAQLVIECQQFISS